MSKIKYFFIVALFFIIGNVSAQITSSTLNGKVTDGEAPIVNATVTIIHLPTNASFEAITDKKGRFSLDNLDVGGPYQLIIKSTEIEMYSRKGIQLVLGDNDMTRDIVVNKKENNPNQEVSNTDKNTTEKSN
ncbi:carboxypeptidase-like regulatory domain-containing protein [Flavobacterium sp. SUN052]|uniref:carboxypeptidase-like regulatory domain-containing protein n=1 Tax=Flavobacterium sp. SUN052 TaxID=3002441 RepID=UPI00237E647A|nr:carboxypeptidase-like regulatory domain-containing protein [Flavobacterium sp. SUN052]MEC4005217.1 carboxypeptidase-like regulatory domain-containing protein [Flavobacterium sp. SUN052]